MPREAPNTIIIITHYYSRVVPLVTALGDDWETRREIVAKNDFIFWLPEAKPKLVISTVIKLVDSSRGWS